MDEDNKSALWDFLCNALTDMEEEVLDLEGTASLLEDTIRQLIAGDIVTDHIGRNILKD